MKPYHKEQSSALYLLPTALMVEERLKELSREAGIIINYRVMTFPELTNIISKDFLPKPRISSIGEIILIKDAADSVLKDAHKPFFNIKDSPIFYRSLNKFFRELRQYLITSEDFKNTVKYIESGKYTAIANIYSLYESALSALNITDDIGRDWAVMKYLENHRGIPPSLSGLKKVVIDGFYELSPIQRRIISAIKDKNIELEIHPVYSLENPDATRKAEDMLNFFETMEDLSPESIIFGGAEKIDNNRDIDYLAKNFLRDAEHSRNAEDGTIRFIAAPNRYMEIEEVGREIRGLLSDDVNPSDIGVVFRDAAPYSEIIIDVFKRFNIPLYFRHGMPLFAMPLIRNILSIYEIIESNFDREKVLKLLNSSYVKYSSLANGKEIEFSKIEEVVLKAGIISEDVERWEDAIERYMRSGIDDTETAISVKEIALTLVKLLKSADKMQRFASHRERLYNIIESLGIAGNKQDKMMDEHQLRDIESFKVFNDAVDEIEMTLEAIGKNAPISLNEFYKMLLESLRDKAVITYNNRSGVKTLSILDARGLKFKYLFICGLNDNEFPKIDVPHPFIREDDKKILNKAFGRRIFLKESARWWEEPLLFMLPLDMAEEKVYLTHSYMDEAGRERIPSIFFREALRILGIDEKDDSPHLKRIPASQVIVKPNDALEKDELIISVIKAVDDVNERDYAEKVIKAAGRIEWFKGEILRLKEINSIERLRESLDAGAKGWMGGIIDNNLLNRIKTEFLGGKNSLSATIFEELAKCSFSFYSRHILRLDEIKKADIEIDNLAAGSILHRILEGFYSTAKKDGMLPLKGNAKEDELLMERAHAAFEHIEKTDFIGNRKLWEIKKKWMTAILKRFLRYEIKAQEDGYLPEYFEIEFGDKKEIPKVELNLPCGETIQISGKIDRIDRKENAVKVIDYKMGFTPDNKEVGRIYFQMPIYIYASSKHLFSPEGYKECRGVYYSLRKPEQKEIKRIKDNGNEMPLCEYIFNKGKRSLASDIDNLLSIIRRGDFAVNPCSEEICAYCRFSNICRIERCKAKG